MESVTFSILISLQIISAFGKMEERPPHIVLIIADDMGSNDVSYRGSNQFTTPNIDALGYNGIILNKHYSEAICTPSRAALLTGQYPIKLGMQGMPMSAGEDRSLPVGVKTLPELLRNLGYKTNLVGKWHLGGARRRDTPTQRGFDTHYGYWNGYVGYFDYNVPCEPIPSIGEVFKGFDLRDKFTDMWKDKDVYATELFTQKAIEVIEKQDANSPMFLMVSHLAVHTGKDGLVEARDEKEMNETFGYIEDLERRRYADALLHLDASVGRIVEKLQEKKMLANTVIVFLSDNGAQIVSKYHNGGSNYPLRGEKMSLHEGGVRNIAVMYSSLLKKKNYVNEKIIHITDWLPTLYGLAGGNLSSLENIDGVNQWDTLSENKNTTRKEILVNIDDKAGNSALIGFDGRYKLLNGTLKLGLFDTFSSDPLNQDNNYNISAVLESLVNLQIKKSTSQQKSLNEKIIQDLRKDASALRNNAKCNNAKKRNTIEICSNFCLFDLQDDPCETENLIGDECKKEIVEELKKQLGNFWKKMIPQTNKPVDINSNPVKYNGTWCTWLDDEFCVKTLKV